MPIVCHHCNVVMAYDRKANQFKYMWGVKFIHCAELCLCAFDEKMSNKSTESPVPHYRKPFTFLVKPCIKLCVLWYVLMVCDEILDKQHQPLLPLFGSCIQLNLLHDPHPKKMIPPKPSRQCRIGKKPGTQIPMPGLPPPQGQVYLALPLSLLTGVVMGRGKDQQWVGLMGGLEAKTMLA